MIYLGDFYFIFVSGSELTEQSLLNPLQSDSTATSSLEQLPVTTTTATAVGDTTDNNSIVESIVTDGSDATSAVVATAISSQVITTTISTTVVASDSNATTITISGMELMNMEFFLCENVFIFTLGTCIIISYFTILSVLDTNDY